ncbi:hypothetical protein EZV62_025765 [Acer yangbiense]|uniref:Ribosomal RNA-processing protein 44 n=1 Tax=Acer yangbiense TaxID=1000413 RepID=A0A5C7GYR6_9ROSI|nr:hypothetical protein EZV62_025765 [Acer yangbiense]
MLVDCRIPKIRIQTQQLGNLLNKRIVVPIDSWDRQSRYPFGHYVRVMGDIGWTFSRLEDIQDRKLLKQRKAIYCLSVGMLATIAMVSILRRFGHNPIRLDLRQIRVFSVDPPGCKDIDDALHCTALPNGNYEVGKPAKGAYSWGKRKQDYCHYMSSTASRNHVYSSCIHCKLQLKFHLILVLTTDDLTDAEEILEDISSPEQESLDVSEISQLKRLPPKLYSLKIEGCDALKSLHGKLMLDNPYLQHLYIIDCHFLESIHESHLPIALKTLYISESKKLELAFRR